MKIFAAFSNPAGDLQGIQQELESLFNFFNSDKIKEKVDFQYCTNKSVPELTSQLIGEHSDTCLFLFSGHSGKDGLNFSSEDFSANHVINFFNTINSHDNKIQCLILNGCENVEIVKKLKDIPVVIGTKTKIKDSSAKKFTVDFFSSLILSGSSYEQAFNEALSAGKDLSYSIYDNTRGEGYIDDIDNLEKVDEYFISKNNAALAASPFPLKKPPPNPVKRWLTYIALIITAAVLFFTIPIIKDWMTTLKCPEFSDPNKCKILVADFNYPQDKLNVNELITEGINENDVLMPYVESKYTAKFTDIIKKNTVNPKDLHSACNYEYTLTGNVFDKGDYVQFAFDIYPSQEVKTDDTGYELNVGDLSELHSMLQNVDLSEANTFIVNKLCLSCAYKNKELAAVVESQIEKLKEDDQSLVAYQHISNELASVYLHHKDTTNAIQALYKVSQAVDNEYALKAIEVKAKLLEETGQVEKAYSNHTEYVRTVDRILNDPDYKKKYDKAVYEKASDKMREKRADTYYQNREELEEKKVEAKKDYEYLREKEPSNVKYRTRADAIQVSNMQIAPTAVTSDVHGFFNPQVLELAIKYVTVKGIVINEKGQEIANAKVRFQNKTVRTNRNGVYSFGQIEQSQVIGNKIGVEAEGYKTRTIKISEKADFEKIVVKPFYIQFMMQDLIRVPERDG